MEYLLTMSLISLNFFLNDLWLVYPVYQPWLISWLYFVSYATITPKACKCRGHTFTNYSFQSILMNALGLFFRRIIIKKKKESFCVNDSQIFVRLFHCGFFQILIFSLFSRLRSLMLLLLMMMMIEYSQMCNFVVCFILIFVNLHLVNSLS